MHAAWKVELYETARSEKPVEKFIDSLEAKARLKVARAHVKKLTGSDLWEYRILGSDNIRIFYVATPGKIFLLLHGFKKKKQKTPTKEIRIAKERLQEYFRGKIQN